MCYSQGCRSSGAVPHHTALHAATRRLHRPHPPADSTTIIAPSSPTIALRVVFSHIALYAPSKPHTSISTLANMVVLYDLVVGSHRFREYRRPPLKWGRPVCVCILVRPICRRGPGFSPTPPLRAMWAQWDGGKHLPPAAGNRPHRLNARTAGGTNAGAKPASRSTTQRLVSFVRAGQTFCP